ncbi:MAG: hypothetical protein AVDCRST_MAG40-3427, partial [uncultured Gemmatimonadaceae bacterium]
AREPLCRGPRLAGPACTRVRRADLAEGAGADRRRDPRAGAAHRRVGAAGGRPRRGAGLRLLPPGAQPPALVGPGGRAPAAGAVAPRLRPARRAGGGRPRRDAGAPLGAQDRRARDPPRPGPLVARPLRQGQRPALVLAHGACARAVGQPGLGPAVPDRAGAVRTLRARARGAAQAADGLGAAGAAPARPLAAWAAHRRGGRPELRRARAAACGARPCLRCGAPAARRPPVRPAAPAHAPHDRPPARRRRAPAHPCATPEPRRHALAPAGDRRLVRRRRARGGGRLRHRRLAPHRPAGRAGALGAGAGSRRRVRPPGTPVHRPRRGAGRSPRLVRPALVGGGDLRRGPAAPRRRNPAPVVGQGRRAHHAGAARPVLARRPAGVRTARAGQPAAPTRCLVPQGGADLQRRA